MKARIGYGLGALSSIGDAESFASLVDGLEPYGSDAREIGSPRSEPTMTAFDPIGIEPGDGRDERR